jgi:hypothetical protein
MIPLEQNVTGEDPLSEPCHIGKQVEYAQGILLMGNFWFDNLSENKSLALCLDGFIENFREIRIQTIVHRFFFISKFLVWSQA